MRGLLFLCFLPAFLFCSGSSRNTDKVIPPYDGPAPEFVFVTSLFESAGANENLLLFEKNISSCSLTLVNTYTVGPDPYDLVYHTGTSTLYVANSGNATISTFKFNTSSKALTSAGTVTQIGQVATLPFMMAVHANGFLYSVDGNATNSSIGQFSQNTSTGVLTQLANPNEYITSAGRLWFIALTGNHVYANDYSNNVIRQFSVNTGTGVLTPFGTPAATGTQPWSMFLHPSGNFLYTTNSAAGGGSVSQYSRDTGTGQLTVIAGGPHNAGNNTIGLAVGTNHVFASATGSGRIYQFSVNTSTGALTANGFVSTVRANPYGIALSRGQDCLYAAELDGVNGASANDEIGIYSNSVGTLTRTGSISGGIGPRFFAVAY